MALLKERCKRVACIPQHLSDEALMCKVTVPGDRAEKGGETLWYQHPVRAVRASHLLMCTCQGVSIHRHGEKALSVNHKAGHPRCWICLQSLDWENRPGAEASLVLSASEVASADQNHSIRKSDNSMWYECTGPKVHSKRWQKYLL